MQYVVVIVSILTLLKDSLAELFKSKAARFILICVIVYILYSVTIKQEQKDELNGDLVNREEGVLAVSVFAALQPILQFKIPAVGYFPVYPNKKDLQELAYTIGQKNIYAKVSEAYKTLYGIELSKHLSNNGAIDYFTEYHTKGKAGEGGKTNGRGLFVREGKRYYPYGNWMLRDTAAPYGQDGITEAGEVYEIVKIITLNLNGNYANYARVKIVKNGFAMPLWERLLAIDSFYKTA